LRDRHKAESALHQSVNRSQIVDAMKMIGMRMGQDHRIEARDLGVEQLLAQIG
jgi:hypothetical protein